MPAKLKKERDSDDEGVDDEIEVVRPPTNSELAARELADVPTIPQSEVSPAAYIFQNADVHDDVGVYEEK